MEQTARQPGPSRRVAVLVGGYPVWSTSLPFPNPEPIGPENTWAALRMSGQDVVSPSYLPDLAHVVLDLLIDGERGVWHLANVGSASWLDIADRLRVQTGLELPLVDPERAGRTFALATDHGVLMPALDSALQRFTRESEDLRSLQQALPIATE